jgi:hypothetical protein
MNPTNSLRAKTLLLVLVAFFILGASGPRPNSGVEAASWSTLTIHANHCISTDPSWDPAYVAYWLKCDGASCFFVCPIHFPTTQDVRIKRFIMYAYDNSDSQVAAYLWRGKPQIGAAEKQAEVATVNTTTDPQKVIDATIDTGNVISTHGSFIYLHILQSDKKVYGFQIKYTILP